MNTVTRTSLLSLLVMSVPFLAQKASASPLVITADSPAFNKDFSIDVGGTLESVPEVVTRGKKTVEQLVPRQVTTYKDVTHDVVAYKPVTRDVITYKTVDCEKVAVTTKVTTLEAVTTKVTTKVASTTTVVDKVHKEVATTKVDKAYVRAEDSERLNLRIGGDTLAMVSRQTTGDFAGGMAFRSGSVALASNINTQGSVTGSVAVSPAKNLAVYAEYDKKAFNYGAQYQTGDVAFQVYSRPSSQAYGFGISLNLGGGQRLSELPGPYLPVNTPSTVTSNGTPIEVEGPREQVPSVKPRVRG
jgi:hypothetical protein